MRLSREVRGSDDAGVVTQLREQQPRHRAIGPLCDLLGERALGARQQQIACFGDPTTDNEGFGIQDRRQVGEPATEPIAHGREGLDRNRVAEPGRLGDVATLYSFGGSIA
jgi:hypothetical protein